MTKKVITLGDVMMRLSTPGFARFTQTETFKILYAGSEGNVASALAGWGVPAVHVTRFPENDFGRSATESLRKYGVDTGSIIYGDERLGLYFLENGAMQRSSRIIYDRFDSAFAHIKPGMINWSEVMKDARWFHWSGITPAISQGAADVCKEALLAARKQDVTISADINYRRNLWQYGKRAIDIMPSLIELSDIIVGGVTDFENCLGITASDFEKGCKEVQKKNPAVKKIANTHRESISSSHNRIEGYLWTGKELLKSQQYDLTHIVDRVGSGDAFMAGLIFGWIHEKTDKQTLEFATSSCALKHSIEGDVNVCTIQEIESVLNGENIGKLLR
jgi:2-dehydro-3-deoxygluconokinase